MYRDRGCSQCVATTSGDCGRHGSRQWRHVQIPLPGGSWVVITAAFPLSADEWTHMIAVLEAMKPGLVQSDA